jgi:3-hydroxybutyryl-CoA dehydrogenase
MGSGIAQVFSQNAFNVTLFDVNETTLQSAREKIDKYAPGTADKIKFIASPDLCKADVIIEAIVENAEIKTKLFNHLFKINSEKTIVVTNTSSLSVTSLSVKLSHPQRFAGMHFFNPAPLMKLVEVVKTDHTSNETIESITALARSLGKIPVECKDSPGFIVNRVARPYYLEALHLLEKNISTISTIDQLMEATGFRMGPFKLMDLIGNDVNYSVSCIVHDAMGKPLRLKPSPIQERKVKEGALGRKSGKGYYEYPGS